jgi:hypothetical protein
MVGSGTDQRLVIRIAADDLVQDHGVRRLHPVSLLREVEDSSLDAPLKACFTQHLGVEEEERRQREARVERRPSDDKGQRQQGLAEFGRIALARVDHWRFQNLGERLVHAL